MLTDNPVVPVVLIIEDDGSDVRLIQQAFQDAPEVYRLRIVGTLQSAWEIIETTPPDLIITSHQLPDGDGNELMVKVDGACPVILMTSQGNEQLAVTAIKAGAHDYISKSPEAFLSLPRIVNIALAEWQLIQAGRKIYQAVSRGKREWEQTFDAVPDLILIIDKNHTISRVNLAMAERCGLSPAGLPGRKCYEVFHGMSSPPACCPFARLMRDGVEHTEEIEEKNLAGFFEITVSPLYDDAGSLTACVHVARDVTGRKKAEEEQLALEQQLQQARKLESLGVLAGGIAHDFNNILMIILGHCFLAKEEADPELSSDNHLKQIEAAAHRAADLCRQMLNYAGKSPLVHTEIDLLFMVEDIVNMLKSAVKKNVCFELDFNRDVPHLTADKAKIQQIVMNLVVNAVEAIGDNNGIVRVALTTAVVEPGQANADYLGGIIAAGTYACLEVSDTGCGMDEETQKRVFEPFFTTKFTGRGLGMSAMIGIIKSHNGSLQLSSKLGEGTTFKVYFPLPAKPDTGELTEDPVVETGGLWSAGNSIDKTILLVDDEEELRNTGSSLLVALGFTVITASNGREALELFSDPASAIDLIVMDLTMPEMDGIETYRELRKTAPAVPILFCSGYGNNPISLHIRDDVYADSVSKPYDPNEVRKILARLLGIPG